jgi:Concanavalin A-like lectin/glucanases superfamily
MSKFLLNARIDNSYNVGTPSVSINGKQASSYSYSTNFPFTDNAIIFNYSFTNNLTTDSTSNAYTLSTNGTVTQSDVTDSTNGITLYNTATFTGSSYLNRNTSSDSLLRSALSASSSYYTSGYSISLWIYATSASGELLCLTSASGSPTIGTDQVFTIYCNGSGSVAVSINALSTAPYLVANYAISQNQWVHLSFIISTYGNNFYINGVPVTMTYSSGSSVTGLTQNVLTNINRLYIGSRYETNYFSGSIKNVIFSSTVWSSDQVKQIYYAQLHDINTYNNSFTGFNADTNTGILRQKNSTYSLISKGQSLMDISTSGTTARNSINTSLVASGSVLGSSYIPDNNILEPITMTSNIQSYVNNAGYVYTYEVTTSSSLSGSNGPYLIFDNNLNSYYSDNTNAYTSTTGVCSSSGPATNIFGIGIVYGTWVQIDMGRIITFTSFSIWPANGYETTRAPNLFYMCGSNDNSTWVPIYTNTLNSTTWVSYTNLRNFTITYGSSYRYYRLIASVVGNSGVSSGRSGLSISQLIFYKTATLSLDGTLNIGRSGISTPLSVISTNNNGLVLNVPSITYSDSSTATWTNPNQYLVSFNQPTYYGVPNVTITNAVLLYLGGAPIPTGNTVITNQYAVYIDSPVISPSITTAASLYIKDAPSISAGTSYAVQVPSGKIYFGGALQFANGALNNYVLTTDNSGNATWQATQTTTFSNGTSVLPSIAFTSETGTGFYRPGTGQIGVELSGINYVNFTTTGNNFARTIAVTPTSNQFVLGSTRTITLTAPTPATSSRTYTIPDANADASFIMTTSSIGQTIAGGLTIGSGSIGLTGTTTFSGASNAVLASGSGAVDFSGNSGIFKTTTGAITIGGSGSTNVTTIPSTLNSSSSTTGALVVSGGVGISSDLRVGGTIYGTVSGTISSTSYLVTTSGTVSAPTYSWSSDTSTGLYRITQNSIGISTGSKLSSNILWKQPLNSIISGIAAYWSFRNNLITDSSTNSYSLTNNGATLTDITDGNGDAMYNTATFNGSSQYLNRNTSSDTNLRSVFNIGSSSDSLIISMWIYNTNSATTGHAFVATSASGLPTGTDQQLQIYYNGSSAVVVSVNIGSGIILSFNYPIVQSTWYHIIVQYGPLGVYFYINGIEVLPTYTVGSNATAGSSINNINNIYIGNQFNTNYWSGGIKNVICALSFLTPESAKLLYNYALSDIGILSNQYYGFTADATTGLIWQGTGSISLTSLGVDQILINSNSSTIKNLISNVASIGGIQTGNIMSTDVQFNEPPTMSSNELSVTTVNGQTYLYRVISISSLGNNFMAYNLFDNSTSTFYEPNNNQYNSVTGIFGGTISTSAFISGVLTNITGVWAQIDMGRGMSFSSYSMLPRSGFETTRCPNTWYILGSNNGSTWYSIDTRSGITWSFVVQTFSISVVHFYRYFRIVVNVVGNPGVSSSRTSWNQSQLTFIKTANNIISGSTWIGSSSTSGFTSTSGAIFNIPTLTLTDGNTASSGTVTTGSIFAMGQPTINATNSSVTTTNAISMYLGGAPIKGTNETFTNSYGLYIDSATTTAATVTEAASLCIVNAPTITSGNTYALKVSSGNTYFGSSSSMLIANTTGSTSSTTGALQVAGGAYFGAASIHNALTTFNANIVQTGAFSTITLANITGSTNSTTGALQVAGGAYFGSATLFNANVTLSGASSILSLSTTGSSITVSGTATSTSSTTGCVQLSGGLGINTATAASSSTNGGSLTTAGGIAVALTSYFGANLILSGISSVLTVSGTASSTSSTTGCVQLSGGLGINNTTDATSTTNGGSLTTAGGIAVAKSIYGAGNVVFDNTSTTAFTIRKASAGGDVFTVDTTNSRIGIGYNSVYIGRQDSATSTTYQRILIDTTSALTNESGITIFNAASSTTGTSVSSINIGKTSSSANAISMGFFYAGSGSTNNKLQFGFNSISNDQFNIRADGSTNVTGTFSVTSTITASGAYKRSPLAINSTTTLTATSASYVVATANTFTITLPSVVGNSGLEYYITNIGTGIVTISVASPTTESFDGNSSYTVIILNQYDRVHLIAYDASSPYIWQTY